MDDIKNDLKNIETKIDKLDTRIDSIDVTLAKQSVILEDHTRRSLANEQQVELLKQKIEIELTPIKEHVNQVHTIFKIIGVISSVAGIASGVVKILEFIYSR